MSKTHDDMEQLTEELAQAKARIRELEKQHSDFLDEIEPYLDNIEAGLAHIKFMEILMNARSAISDKEKR